MIRRFSTVGRNANSTTHFGFKTIPTKDKESMVRSVFESVAGNYDTMNDFMSAGIHRLWKDEFVAKIAPNPYMKLLDVAGGTGYVFTAVHRRLILNASALLLDRDIAFRFQEFNQREFGVAVDENIRLVDINPAMLEVGRQRASARGYHLMSFEEGNAQDLKGTRCFNGRWPNRHNLNL
jgi:ubiquinone/menaquinone biosynthesis C-methylase UbiE